LNFEFELKILKMPALALRVCRALSPNMQAGRM